MVETNLLGSIYGSRAAMRVMREQDSGDELLQAHEAVGALTRNCLGWEEQSGHKWYKELFGRETAAQMEQPGHSLAASVPLKSPASVQAGRFS